MRKLGVGRASCFDVRMSQPDKTERALQAERVRKEREAVALRENLRRRKEQARARVAEVSERLPSEAEPE